MTKTEIPPELVEAYQRREVTLYEIAQRVEKAPSTVYNALKGKVDTSAYRQRFRERNQKILQIYEEGKLSLEEIGKKCEEWFGKKITKQRVKQIIESLKNDRCIKSMAAK
jgi:hypothetical protein